MIVVNLGTDEDMIPDVVADAPTNVHQKVMAANKAGAEIYAAGCGSVTVEASTLPSDASHQIQADLLADLGLIHSIEVGNYGTKRLPARTTVRSLARFPSRLKAETDAFVEDDIGTDAGIQAPLLGTEAGIYVARSGGHDRAETEHGIALLGGGKLGEQQESENGGEQR